MQSFYKDKISGIEDAYAESRQKREARIKERVVVLEQQAKVFKDWFLSLGVWKQVPYFFGQS